MEPVGVELTQAPLLALPGPKDLPLSREQTAAFAKLSRDGSSLVAGWVVSLDRGYPLVVCDKGYLRGEFSADLSKGRTDSGHTGVSIGDAVALKVLKDHATAIIAEVLPRKNELFRRRDRDARLQVLAANVDAVAVVAALGQRPLNLARIARFLVLALETRSDVFVVLTKADRADTDEIIRDIHMLEDLTGAPLEIVVTSCKRGKARGKNDVLAHIPPGVSCVFLGESGAGKSTLINELVGENILETASVRSKGDTGRHTTVVRRMVQLPGGGVALDAPGIKSVSVAAHSLGLETLFSQFSTLSERCLYPKCSHETEPGCALREFVEKNPSQQSAFSLYRELLQEV